jgi:hypothetical protein
MTLRLHDRDICTHQENDRTQKNAWNSLATGRRIIQMRDHERAFRVAREGRWSVRSKDAELILELHHRLR